MLNGLKYKIRAFARVRGEQGSTLVEFALLLVVLMPIVMGIIVFGIAFNNYLAVSNAANIGAQALSVSRGGTSDVCTLTTQSITSAAGGLTPSSLTTAITIYPPTTTSNTNPCTGSASFTQSGTGIFSCGGTGSGSGLSYLKAQGCVQVKVSYPCSLVVYGANFGGKNCTLTTTTAEAVQ